MTDLGDAKTLAAARARHDHDDMVRDLARSLKIDAQRIRQALDRAGLTLKREP